MQTGARLLSHALALGEDLILEHVSMPARFATVDGKRIAGPNGLEARIFFELGTRYHRTRISLAGRAGQGFAPPKTRPYLIGGAPVTVVLQREVFPPDRRVYRLIRQLNHTV